MRVYLSVLLMICLAGALSAQDIQGTISGTVTDSQGASIMGANVEVTNADTNVTAKLTTNASGYYEARNLLPGPYRVTVETAGFKKFVRSNLIITMRDQLRIDAQLEVGAVSESVTVTGESPILDTSTSNTGKALTTREVMDLPVMSNNIVLLARVASGVVNQGTTQYLAQGMVGGSSGFFSPLSLGQNEWSIDGASNLGSGSIAFTPFTDQISEFKIETTNFDASFGHALGLNVSFSTKSGTNELHGSATEQYWNTHWNAAPFFVKQKYFQNIASARAAGNTALADQLRSQPMQPGGHSNDYGFTVGGPVYIPKVINGKNKLFFFFSLSQNKTRQPARTSEITDTVPTTGQRTGNFADLLAVNSKYQIYDPLSVAPDPARPSHYIRMPIAGNIIPQSRILAPKIFNWYTSRLPSANSPVAAGAEPFNNFLALGQSDNVNYTGISNRTDYAPTQNHRFSFSWSWSHFLELAQDWTYGTDRGLQDWDNHRIARNGILNWSFSKSSSTVITASLAANEWLNVTRTEGVRKYKPSDIGFPHLSGPALPGFERMRRASGHLERVPERRAGKRQYANEPQPLQRRPPALDRAQVERNAYHGRTLFPGWHRFPAGLPNRSRRRRESHGELLLRQHFREKGRGRSCPLWHSGSELCRVHARSPQRHVCGYQRQLRADEPVLRLVWSGHLARYQKPDTDARAARGVRTGPDGTIQPGPYLLRQERSAAHRHRGPGRLRRPIR